MWSRARALWSLGWALVRALLTWPWRHEHALQRFADNYGAEGLLPVGPEVHALLVQSGRCTGCRRCDTIVPSGAPGSLPLSTLILGAARSLPDYDLAARAFAAYGPSELAAAERLCPWGVPIPSVASLVQTQRTSSSLGSVL